MDKGKGLLNGNFTFKTLPDGSLDKTKVICLYCRCELSYHRSTSSLKYHLLAKHTIDAEIPTPAGERQTTRRSLQQRSEDNFTYGEVTGRADNQENERDEDEKVHIGSLPVVSRSFSLMESSPSGHQDVVSPQKRRRQTMTETDMSSADSLSSLRDEDEMFLLSLLPSLKRLTIKKRMEVRMKFQQVLYAAEFED